jgi:hypothetical protein
LREEMYEVAGVDCDLYDSERFLQFARTYLGLTVEDATIQEAADVRQVEEGQEALWMRADHQLSVVVQSGYVTAEPNTSHGHYKLVGDRFDLTGHWTEEGNVAGDPGPHELGADYQFSGGISADALATGFASIGGEYDARVEYSGALRVWVARTTLPREASDTIVPAPFAMIGRVSGFRDPDDRFEQHNAIFAAALTGHGTAHLEFACERAHPSDSRPLLVLKRVTYVFG